MKQLSLTWLFISDVLLKLLAFTFAMVVVPIGSYFLTVHTVFAGMCLSSIQPTHHAVPLSPGVGGCSLHQGRELT